MDIQNNTENTLQTNKLLEKPEVQRIQLRSSKPQLKTILVAIPLLLIAIVITSFFVVNNIAQDSLPGESLYSFKTRFAEKVILYTKINTESKLSYEQHRFETRLKELIALSADTSTSSAETIGTLAWLSGTHADSIIAGIAGNAEVRTQNKVEKLAELSTSARAMEIVSNDNEELKSISEQVSENERKASEALESEIKNFVAENDETAIGSFLSEQIQYVAEHAQKLSFGSTAQNLVLRRVAETQEAIASANMIEAISYILRARQAIRIDGYLQKSERAPENGILPEPQAMPEGS